MYPFKLLSVHLSLIFFVRSKLLLFMLLLFLRSLGTRLVMSVSTYQTKSQILKYFSLNVKCRCHSFILIDYFCWFIFQSTSSITKTKYQYPNINKQHCKINWIIKNIKIKKLSNKVDSQDGQGHDSNMAHAPQSNNVFDRIWRFYLVFVSTTKLWGLTDHKNSCW